MYCFTKGKREGRHKFDVHKSTAQLTERENVERTEKAA